MRNAPLALVTIYSAWQCIGQAPAPIVDSGITMLVGNLGIMGVLVWHLWYHTTHSYPSMLEKFSLELKLMREAFQREQDRSREHCGAEVSAIRDMLIQTLQSMRTAVHDVKDTAQVVMNKVTMAEQKHGEGS